MKEVARIRQERGLTQGQLAEMCGVSQATISRVESGAAQPSLGLIEAMAKALRVSPSSFFDMPDLQARLVNAFSQLSPDQQRAALLLIEGLAADTSRQW
jgi:transcriptional regulator with XRE-family HTH domain